MSQEVAIRDLALIGDRRTAALLTRYGDILWYCPRRFDAPSLFAALLDVEVGGAWKLNLKGTELATRRYLEDSGVLETCVSISGDAWTIIDFMPYGDGTLGGICRLFSSAPEDIRMVLQPTPDYARRRPEFEFKGEAVVIDGAQTLHASHPLFVEGDTVRWTLPEGNAGWAVLLDEPHAHLNRERIEGWLEQTLASWRRLASHATYEGPYEEHIADSLRALRLLTFKDSGGIIAAPTTSLPEVVGGRRNYDTTTATSGCAIWA